jgi:hypothetical protein
MSGLTGYLLSDGVTDLSYVFQRIGSQSTSSLIPTSIMATSEIFYPCFASTNASSLGQIIYTDLSGSVSFNKATNTLNLPAISISGPINATYSSSNPITMFQKGGNSITYATTSVLSSSATITNACSIALPTAGTYLLVGSLRIINQSSAKIPFTNFGPFFGLSNTSLDLSGNLQMSGLASSYSINQGSGNYIQLPISTIFSTNDSPTIYLNYYCSYTGVGTYVASGTINMTRIA